MNHLEFTQDQLHSPHWQPEFSVAFLLQIINGISNPIFVKDSQRAWVFVNDAFCDFSGHSREDLLGKSDYDFFPKQQAEVFWQTDELVFTTGIANENEEHFTDASGVSHVISTKKSLFEDRTGNKFLVGTIQDITQKIEKEQQAQEALVVAYAEMETLVLERTKELAQTNEALQAEITEHEETELALRESEEKLQKLAANVPGMLFQFMSQPNGSMLMPYVSSGSYEIYGLTPFEIQAEINLIISTIHPDDRQDYEESVAVSARTLQPFRWEGRAVLSCGQVKWIKCVSRPEAQANGSILWHGVILDITERKLAEEELTASQQRLALLVEQTPVGVIEWNTNFQIQDWNSAAEKIFGYTKEEVLGRNFKFLVPQSLRKHVLQVMADLLAQQGGTDSVNENITKEGRAIVCEWHNNPLVTHSGKVIGVASMILDITERKRAFEEQQKAEDALRKSEARLRLQAKELEQALNELQRTQIHLVQSAKMLSLGQLVAGIAHEINNPVNFIYGNLCHTEEYTKDLLRLLQLYEQHYPVPVSEIEDFVELIELDFLTFDLQQTLNSMKVGAERIRSIVLSLRTFSRLDEAEMKTVDIHEGIDSALMILQSRLNGISVDAKQSADQHRPAIEVIKEYSNLPLVECYAGQLNQVFLNILTNAIDALEDRIRHGVWGVGKKPNPIPYPLHPTPQIRIHTELIELNQVKIRISDNGIGIPQELKQRIFDPFFTTKPVGKGVGLGLSISYQIVTERHGGILECISEPGKGAEFVITIPLGQH